MDRADMDCKLYGFGSILYLIGGYHGRADEKESVCGSGRSYNYYRFGWLLNWVVVLAAGGLLIGCTTIKKVGVTALAAAGGATAATVLSGGVAAPILGGTTGAFVGDVATEVMMSNSSKEKVMTDCAPDNFWTLLGELASMGGWLLILIIVIPMVLGWFLPGPVKLKGKDK